VKLAQVGDAMRLLAEAGLTTREACGNAVRNVTTSPSAGVAVDEVFDPTPYANALTRHFLRHPLSASLPRKFKVAFSGGGEDHAYALVNDLAFTARLGPRGERGFRVTVGGGTALMCKSGTELFGFLPAGDILGVADAVLRVFHANGDREHRKKNRMKFLIKKMGWDAWLGAVHGALELVRAEGAPSLPFATEAPPEEVAPTARAPEPRLRDLDPLLSNDRPRGPGFVPRHLPSVGDPHGDRFRRTNVRAQRQAGFSAVTAVVPLGDLTSGRLRALAALSRAYADGTVRTTTGQNVLLRWVPTDRVAALHAALVYIGLGDSDPESLADVAACPGAESCKLAVTQSRGLADSLNAHFRHERSALDRAKGLTIRSSACPNGCGLHHVAGIGFQGGLRKVDGRAVPQYHLSVGGSAGGSEARFGRLIARIPARRAALAVERLIALYEHRRMEGETVTAYLQREDAAELTKAVADLEKLDASTARPEDFIDLGEDSAFRPETTEGECAS